MDTESLLKSLNARAVDYVVIGATAFPVHGYVRSTLDVDIFVRPERDNAHRTLAALSDAGYDVTDLTVDELLEKKILLRQYLVEADIHPFVEGRSFDAVWAGRVQAHYGETPTCFAGLEDLIAMKKAAGRPKDLEDLKHLRKLRRDDDADHRE
jgi:hypothetical protein